MRKYPWTFGFMIVILLTATAGCGRDSSPEGRMSIKVETLQKDMLQKMEQQNKAILDSLAKMREELDALKHAK
jgi:hypothetical protein